MKKKIDIVGNSQIKNANSPKLATDTIIYEVSRRPHNKHKKQLVADAKNLRTPSGGKVPPAWKQVWVTTDPHGDIQAIGRDTKARRVYLYSTEHMGRATAAKFSHLKAFAEVYPRLIKKIQRDKRTSEEALVLYLIAKTGFRVGNNSKSRATVNAFGASTLRCSHVKVERNHLSFEFTGKKGIRIRKALKDKFLAKEISKRCQQPTDTRIFKATDDGIRAYLSSITESIKFTVKDFRTYLGTLTAFQKIKSLPIPQNSREYQRYRKVVGETVAKELGNSSGVSLKAYIAPEVFCDWESRLPVPLKKTSGTNRLSSEFFECIQYDQEVTQDEYMDEDPLEHKE